ncbi:unnamed protein product [Hydatigera taeniaeformis]|uniref:Armadillo repeat-containing protein 1 n=1 Tax=Hydatigena taeniaeformis TaxID=6205 RepID=A0A0R3X2F2_HYDTA|nr:unnamed protein product [Hydatigera taeniaeformis]
MTSLVASFKAIALDDSRCQSLLAVFFALAKRENGSVCISRLHGLREQLLKLQEDDENTPLDVKNLSHKLYHLLYSTEHHLKRSNTKTSRFKGHRKSHTVVVQLSENIGMSDLKVIESHLLTIKGIISITFQLNKFRVVVMAVDAVEPEQILDKVTVACQKLVLENGLVDTPACFIRGRKSTQVSLFFAFRSFFQQIHLLVLNSLTVPFLFCCIFSCSRVALHRRDTIRSGYTAVSSTMPPPRQPKSRPKPKPLKPYLADGADIFEVDPSHGVPQRRDAIVNDANGTSRGFGGWLSDLLERTVFW